MQSLGPRMLLIVTLLQYESSDRNAEGRLTRMLGIASNTSRRLSECDETDRQINADEQT